MQHTPGLRLMAVELADATRLQGTAQAWIQMIGDRLVTTRLGWRDRFGGDAALVLALEPPYQRSHAIRCFGLDRAETRLDIRYHGV